MGVILEDVTPDVYDSMDKYLEVVDAVREAAKVYENTPLQPLMDDFAYDMLLRGLRATEEAHPEWKVESSPSDTVGAGVGDGGDVIHTTPMLSLDNVFNETELYAWNEKLTRALGRPAKKFVVEPKLDGLALSARYEKGKLTMLLLRGSGSAGEDVSHNAKLISGLPSELNDEVTLEIRGECFMSNENFTEANTLRVANGETAFVNARNGAAGTIRSKSRAYDIPLSFLAYGVLGYDHLDHSEAMAFVSSLGVKITKDSKAGMGEASDIKEVLKFIQELSDKRGDLDFEIDGAVIKADLAADRDEAGFTSRAPRWGIAWKYPADSRTTILKKIELQVGRTGAVTPVAVLEPVFVGGTTVGQVTLHNATEIARKDLREGDTVWVRRAGEVIPEVVAVQLSERKEDSVPWTPPSACPRCGGDLNTTQKVWRCKRGRECGLGEAIYYYASKACLDIESIGEKLARVLVDKQLVKDVSDLYSLSSEQLSGLERMGATSAQNVLSEIEKSKSQPLSRVFAGLGVRLTGVRMSRRLASHFGSMDAILSASIEDLSKVEGVGDGRALSIFNELQELAPVISALAKAGVNMSEPGFGEAENDSPKPLRKEDGTPKSVVVTGSVPGFSRTEAQEAVIRLGGKPSGSVSKKTDLVVIGENAGSKEAKAIELKLEIMSAEDFAKLASS